MSSLEALCYNVKEYGVICSLIDAKNDNCYWSIFENIGKSYLLRRDFDVNTIDNILSELKSLNLEYKLAFVGDGASSYKDKILKAFPENNFGSSEILPSNLALAGLKAYNERKLK